MMQIAEQAKSATALEKLKETTLTNPDYKTEATVVLGWYGIVWLVLYRKYF